MNLSIVMATTEYTEPTESIDNKLDREECINETHLSWQCLWEAPRKGWHTSEQTTEHIEYLTSFLVGWYKEFICV